jgi:hypothetical protein
MYCVEQTPATGLTEAQQLALGSRGADFGGSQTLLGQAAQQAQLAAAQPGFNQAQGTIQQGIGQLSGATQGYSPASAQAFMDPYRQKVIDETLRQIERQGTIAQQGLSAQAVRSGAFGGTREGVQRAELERGLLEQKSNTIANLLSQGYSQAQAQAMQSFEQQQGRQMQAGQGIGQLGAQQAAVAGQQAGLGQSAAQQLAQVGQTIGQQAAQQAQLGQATAGLYGNLAQNQVAAGQGLGQLGLQQAQLGQGAAGQYLQAAQQYGNLAGQGGALAGQESAINQNIANLMMQQAQARNQAAQTSAGIYGQQAQQFQGLGQGIGGLAGQEFGQGTAVVFRFGSVWRANGPTGYPTRRARPDSTGYATRRRQLLVQRWPVTAGDEPTTVGCTACHRVAKGLFPLPTGRLLVRHLQGRTFYSNVNGGGQYAFCKPVPTGAGSWLRYAVHRGRCKESRTLLRGQYEKQNDGTRRRKHGHHGRFQGHVDDGRRRDGGHERRGPCCL